MAGLLHPQYQSVTHPRKGGGVEEGVGRLVVSGMEVSSKHLQEDGGTAITTALQRWGMGTLAGEGDLNRKPQHPHTTMISPFGR